MARHGTPTRSGPSFARRTLDDVACPACCARGARSFYRLDGLPAHDCMLMRTREEALAHPCRDLELAHCPGCGLVFNAVFDPEVHDYSASYEETQGFSPTFGAYAREVAGGLIERFGLHGKTVLEIGCGKGEFLVLLCREAAARGVGVDPAYAPGRLPEEDVRDLVFHREFFRPEHFREHRPDFVLCRHTLEHVHDVGAFLALLREAIGDRRDVPVWFDLPDARRVWREGAFWDVYYEHCSYFGAGALARAFRAAGFAPFVVQREYGDQYLAIGAMPAAAGEEAEPLAPEETPEETPEESARDVEAFRREAQARIERFGTRLRDAHAAGGRTVLWGGGSKGVAFLTTLGLDEEVAAAVDINPHKQGMFLPATGHEVLGPEALRELRPTQIVVMNPIYVDEIGGSLRELGLEPEILSCR